MKPRHTNSTGNTEHLRITQALGSGTAGGWGRRPHGAGGVGWVGGWLAGSGGQPRQGAQGQGAGAAGPLALFPLCSLPFPRRTRQQRVGHQVRRLLHPPGAGLVEDLALEGDGRQQAVKGRLPVGGHNHQLIPQVVRVAHLALCSQGAGAARVERAGREGVRGARAPHPGWPRQAAVGRSTSPRPNGCSAGPRTARPAAPHPSHPPVPRTTYCLPMPRSVCVRQRSSAAPTAASISGRTPPIGSMPGAPGTHGRTVSGQVAVHSAPCCSSIESKQKRAGRRHRPPPLPAHLLPPLPAPPSRSGAAPGLAAVRRCCWRAAQPVAEGCRRPGLQKSASCRTAGPEPASQWLCTDAQVDGMSTRTGSGWL